MLLGDKGIVARAQARRRVAPGPRARHARGREPGRADPPARRSSRATTPPARCLTPTPPPSPARSSTSAASLVVGAGGVYELTPRVSLAAEAQLFLPLPGALSYGPCRRYNGGRCGTLDGGDYFGGASAGDLTVLATAGGEVRLSADLAVTAMIGTGPLGARGEDVRITTGLVWAPQPEGSAAPGRGDKDGDGIPDTVDAVPRRARGPRTGSRTRTAARSHDNDGDGIPDAPGQVPGRARGQGRLRGRRRLPRPRQRQGRPPRRQGPVPRRARGQGRLRGRGRLPRPRQRQATASPTPRTSARSSRRPTTASRTRTAAPTAAAPPAPRSAPTGSILAVAASVTFLPGGAALVPRPAASLPRPGGRARQGAPASSVRVEVHVPLGTRSPNAALIAQQKRRDKAPRAQQVRQGDPRLPDRAGRGGAAAPGRRHRLGAPAWDEQPARRRQRARRLHQDAAGDG